MDKIRVAKVESVRCTRHGATLSGTVHLTAHHLIFKYDQEGVEELWTAYPLISLVTRMPHTLSGEAPLAFRTCTFDTFTLTFVDDSQAFDVFESVKELTVVTSVTQLYAFNYKPQPPLPSNEGWTLYTPRTEFQRMGVGSRTKAWRYTDINKDYGFCSTYPAKLVIPAKISDATLQYAVKYRSKARIPVLTYLHWANLGTLTRSSQPMVGLTNNRSLQDEKLVEAVFQSHLLAENPLGAPAKIYGATATNMIIDARPTANAMVMVAKGAGTENMDYYKDCKKAYLGIDNIHVMRDSLNRVFDALRESEMTESPIDRDALRRSGWLKHMANVLEGTAMIVNNVHVNASHVLIHCSDGWDRTSQLAALAQLCLDPYYRTYKGFQVLVEKDWLSFGHRFLDRCGHLSSDKLFISAPSADADGPQAFLASVQNRFGGPAHLKETSPVFHQFLECIRILQHQFPKRFEYNSRMLERVHHHLYSCQFGTFLYNNERERREADAASRTVSVWDWLNTDEERALNLNSEFDKSLDDPKSPDMGVLAPDAKDVRFWNELYGREDEEMNGQVIETTPASLSAPIDSAEDDVVFDATVASEVAALAQSVPTISSPSLTPPGVGQVPISRSVPTLPPQDTIAGSPPLDRQDSFRPFTGTSSAFSMRSQTRTPEPVAPAGLPLFGAGGAAAARSMWGAFSTHAAAALTAAQGAAAGAAKELNTRLQTARDASPGPDPATSSRGGELPAWGGAEWGDAPSHSSSRKPTPNPPSPSTQRPQAPATYSHSSSHGFAQQLQAQEQKNSLIPPTGMARSPPPLVGFGQRTGSGSVGASATLRSAAALSANPWATNAPTGVDGPLGQPFAAPPVAQGDTTARIRPSLQDLSLTDPVVSWKTATPLKMAEAPLPPPPPPDKEESKNTNSDPLGVGPL
ncbi:phosphotyrosine protein [Auriculariales sp. MPI-PUGE-AT-0066]|nr:phosphotyrosine protein [Auriculariales sp. MPI-PUGE-AT-0066]